MTDRPARKLPFSAHDARRLSVESFVDPRTITAFFAGKNVRPTIAARLTEALAKLGLPGPETTTTSSTATSTGASAS